MPRSTRHLRVRRLKADIIPLFDQLESGKPPSPGIKWDLSLFYNFLLNRFEWFQLDIIQQFDELDSLTNQIHLPLPSDISAYISILPDTVLNRLRRFQLEITHEFDLDSNILNVIPLLPCGPLGSQPSEYFKSRMPSRAPNKSFRRRTLPFPISNRDLQLRSMILPICVSLTLIFSVAKSSIFSNTIATSIDSTGPTTTRRECSDLHPTIVTSRLFRLIINTFNATKSFKTKTTVQSISGKPLELSRSSSLQIPPPLVFSSACLTKLLPPVTFFSPAHRAGIG
jgi:hypothetical protein